MKLTILGTGNAMATECYNTCFALEEDGKCFLVDAGGGNTIMKRLKDANIDWKNVRDIFVTHKHIDHITGMIWIIRLITQNMSQDNYEGEATIYGHEEVIDILRKMSSMLLQKKQSDLLDKRLHLVVLNDGDEKEILGHHIQFFDIGSTKARQFGFSMDLRNGEKLTCCGDEPYKPCEEKYAMNSTWLLHEAFCLYGQADVFHPYEKHHSTVKDASELAETLHAKNLILYHTEDKNIKNRKELYMAEGKQYFHGNLYVPDDMETFEV